MDILWLGLLLKFKIMKKFLWIALLFFVPCIAQDQSDDPEFLEIDNTTVPIVYEIGRAHV